ncbi:MAG: hypothetical protein ACI9EF_002989 [Pseudohongiellaceae bacterium]|jgi:hypothetical protein
MFAAVTPTSPRARCDSTLRRHSPLVTSLPPRPRNRTRRRATALCLVALLSAASSTIVSAQDSPTDLGDLREQLAQALATITQLQQRVDRLESQHSDGDGVDDLEAQLQALLIDEPSTPAQPIRTLLPSAYNPRIGIFVEALAEGGNADEMFGTGGDRFSVREIEMDFSLPLSPFAEATFIAAFEDLGSGEFESRVEEAYADVNLGALSGTDTRANLRAGRFRLAFGADNRLHTHDLPQADRPLAVSQQLGPEGLIGDGLQLSLPVWTSENDEGLFSTSTADIALVNGDMFTGDEAILGELAGGAGLTLDSDAPLVVARASHFIELDRLSDLELGASWLSSVGSRAVVSDVGTKINPQAFALDLTWRSRDDESGRDSWLLAASGVRTSVDFGQTATPGFPTGGERSDGYWLTAQRQSGANTYWGVRVGSAEVLGTSDDISAISPYVSWYADEFFRVRLQGQRLRGRIGGDRRTAHRALLQLSWNFGAHRPHPYWSNR